MKLAEPVAPLLSSKCLSRLVVEQGFTQPKRIKVLPPKGSAIDQCYVNVVKHVARAGGHGLYGWKILEFPGLFLQAIHHAVWVNKNSRMIDVTPDVRRWKQQVFAPIHATQFIGVPVTPIAPRAINICGLAEVDEALEISQELTTMRLKQALPNGMIPAIDNQNLLVNKLSDQALDLLVRAQAKVGMK